MIRRVVLVSCFLFLLVLASAHHYDQDDDCGDDYYWAKEYYHTSDYDEVGQYRYYENTYHDGDKFYSFEDYKAHLYYKNNPWMKVYEKPRVKRPDFRDRRYRDDYDFPGIKGYHVYHSVVIDEPVVGECYHVPPSDSIFYVKC